MGKTADKLPERIGTWDVFSLGIGTAVGISIFVILGDALKIAGPAILLSVFVAAVPMVFWTLNKVFLASTVPVSGASYIWPARFIHPYIGYIVTWARMLGQVMVLVVLGLALHGYLENFVGFIPARLFIIIFLSIVFVLNVVGLDTVGRVQTAMVVILLVIFAVFIVWGATQINTTYFTPFIPNGGFAILVGASVLVSLFQGIAETIEASEEVVDPGRSIPRGLFGALAVGVVLYALVFGVALGVVGPKLAGSPISILTAATQFMGGGIAQAIILPALLIGVFTTANATFMGGSRFLFSMGRDTVLPEKLSEQNDRFGTPHVALTTLYVASVIVAIFVPLNVISLILGIVIAGLLSYGFVSLSVNSVLMRRPELYEQAEFKYSKTVHHISGIAGAIFALLLLISGFQASTFAYLILAVWVGIGTVWYLWRQQQIDIRSRMTSDSVMGTQYYEKD